MAGHRPVNWGRRSRCAARRRAEGQGMKYSALSMGKIGSRATSRAFGEVLERRAVRVALPGAEDLDGHPGTPGRPSVTAPAGDRQAPDILFQPALSEDVVPKPDPLDQFTLGVSQPHDRDRLARAIGDRVYPALRLDLRPAPRRQADLRRVAEVGPRPGIVDPEPEAAAGVAPVLVDPVEILVVCAFTTMSGVTGSSRPTQSPSSVGIEARGPRRGGRSIFVRDSRPACAA